MGGGWVGLGFVWVFGGVGGIGICFGGAWLRRERCSVGFRFCEVRLTGVDEGPVGFRYRAGKAVVGVVPVRFRGAGFWFDDGADRIHGGLHVLQPSFHGLRAKNDTEVGALGWGDGHCLRKI